MKMTKSRSEKVLKVDGLLDRFEACFLRIKTASVCPRNRLCRLSSLPFKTHSIKFNTISPYL